MNHLPLDHTTKHLTYHSVPRGGQAIIRMEGSDGILVVANPDDGRRPYFYCRDGAFTDIARAGKEEVMMKKVIDFEKAQQSGWRDVLIENSKLMNSLLDIISIATTPYKASDKGDYGTIQTRVISEIIIRAIEALRLEDDSLDSHGEK